MACSAIGPDEFFDRLTSSRRVFGGLTSFRPITLRFSDVVLAEEERMIHHEGHEDHEGERNDKTRPSSLPVSCVSHALLRVLRALRGRNSYLR